MKRVGVWGFGGVLLMLGGTGCSACSDFARFTFDDEDAGPDAGRQLDSGPGEDAEVDAFVPPDAPGDDAGPDDDAGMLDAGPGDAGGCPEVCDDGIACNGISVCDESSGTCVLGTSPTPCDDGIACTDDECAEPTGACSHTAVDARCPEGQLCVFVDGACDTARSCVADADCMAGERCSVGLCCEPPTGGCELRPCTTQADCDDGVFCNGTETCNSTTGSCESGAMVDCDDGIGCTVDRCDEDLNVCVRSPDDTVCDDTLFCNGAATCSATADCIPGTAPDCDDADACTTDDCSEPMRACRHRTRDADGDLHGDAVCTATGGVPADDCDDTDPLIFPGAIDVCNGDDDDCDGMRDEMNECAAGSMGTCTTGCGTTGSRTCSTGCVWSICSPPFETCNGRDDNCNSSCDESFACCAGSSTPCTTTCGSTGARTCGADCTLGACTPPAEACNGLDDDCDTMPDDGFTCVAGTTASCPTACGSTGTRTCTAPGCTYGACVPPAEACNGTDDDCDTRIDESVECSAGSMGPCTTSCGTLGSRTCSAMCNWGTCTPPAEACNAMDDDCDGVIDDGFACISGTTTSCATTCGTTGTRTCSATCVLGACVPPAEVCDGADNDCDAMADETFTCRVGATRSCATACGSTGSQTCTSACEWGTCSPPAEVCNGADDDCDGSADEGFMCVAGASESCGASCGSSGTRTCSAACTWGACLPPAEVCNGADDDCDTMCDDGFTCCAGATGSCPTSCGSTGTRLCSGSCAWGVCNPPAETCNGADDDCDTMCDDGFACCRGSTLACTTSCGTAGSRTCNASCTVPATCNPPPETCNGVDDDCDTACDEGFGCCRGTTLSCTTSCGTTGTRICSPSCTVPSGCTPPAETCNGLDDDCDATCDDGFACCRGATVSCTTSCGSTGSRLCSATCTLPATCNPPVESCNGDDDDCDGTVDEGFPVFTLYRDADEDGYGTGPAAAFCDFPTGYASSDGDCDDSDPAINPGVREDCDNLDNDCDSMVDEDCDDDRDDYCDADLIVSGAPSICREGGGDCDDTNAAIHPNATEICANSVDEDCDFSVDEECPPGNDTCASAINLGRIGHGVPGGRMGDPFDGATVEVTSCGSGPEIWYSFEILEPLIVYFDDFGTSFDAMISARAGCASPGHLACNDGQCGASGDAIIMVLTAPGIYKVAVHARDATSMSGTVNLHWQALRPARASNTRVTMTSSFSGLTLPNTTPGNYSPTCFAAGGVNGFEAGYYFNVCPGGPGRATRAENCTLSGVGDVIHYLIGPTGGQITCQRNNCGTGLLREDASAMIGGLGPVGLHMWVVDNGVPGTAQSYSVNISF